MDWIRGDSLGCGSSSTVDLAICRGAHFSSPSVMAVKSCEAMDSDLLKNEKRVLDQIGNSPHIVRCLGDDISFERGQNLHNLFLEYASGGSLADHVKKSGGRLPESAVRSYTRSILKGLNQIHGKGFVHCDIKLQNLLVFENGGVKIADFGLAKRTGEAEEKQGRDKKVEIRGTPLFMAPESVNENVYEPPCDIWALGCAVVEMLTGKPAWNYKPGTNIYSFLIRIGAADESPAIPEELSAELKEFLSNCFVRDPAARWTAAMLLEHPFLSADETGNENDAVCCSWEEFPSVSPRCPFDFPEWVSSVQSSPAESGSESNPFDSLSFSSCSTTSPAERIRQLASVEQQAPFSWGDSGSWLVVR
ncbi:unnamed protein product [Linum tenue]|uniref:Protein kinase domain-containing protein n=3 Tax=Linum tenue TaxID=586396 RepID=A0AAV0L745_9ROSI|nr:unnamed protein product [Linum tenue]